MYSRNYDTVFFFMYLYIKLVFIIENLEITRITANNRVYVSRILKLLNRIYFMVFFIHILFPSSFTNEGMMHPYTCNQKKKKKKLLIFFFNTLFQTL
jgi:hypothetical protein